MQAEVHEGGGGGGKAAGNSEPFKASKGACHRARVQGAYVYTVFENLTYGSGQPYVLQKTCHTYYRTRFTEDVSYLYYRRRVKTCHAYFRRCITEDV
jgi:hypothetical protein